MPIFGGPKVPAIPAVPPAAHPATAANPNVVATGANSKSRAIAGALASGTNLTGGEGLMKAPKTSGNTLLGE